MKLVTHLDAEATQQLAEIEHHTNQDSSTIVHQALGLYHQQIQQSGRVQLAKLDSPRRGFANDTN